jgi:mannose/cellobiose epimerase-like protein (N-acyl-D-glucosamine 2-epimerase family)
MTDEASGRLSDWLATTLLPGWLDRVYDPARPGFVEWVEPDGSPLGGDARSALVTARLVYVFSHAHLLGVPGALAAARHGMSFLWEVCRGPDGRFRYRCTVSGEALDPRSDLYDLAFVLFALGWFARATGEREAIERAEAVMAFIETKLAHPQGGFREDTLGTLPRRQNPHMHLLEACHALAEASGDAAWLGRAETLVLLMREKMLDRGGMLAEFFTEGWDAAPGAQGLIREPGHHYEWVWLLHHHHRLTGSSEARRTALSLYDIATRHHFASATAPRPVVNAIDPEGRVLDGEALLWPQTEYLKALAARSEFEDDAEALPLAKAHLALVFDRFVDRRTGLWANRLDAEGRPVPEPIPVRVLYHLLLACAEVERVRGLAGGDRERRSAHGTSASPGGEASSDADAQPLRPTP